VENSIISRLFLTLALVALALSWGDAALVAQEEHDASTLAAQQQQQPDAMNQDQAGNGQLPDTNTFSGKIVKSGNEFVLQDSIGESTYQLDVQARAKAFAGKDVRIMGTVDALERTVHISGIELDECLCGKKNRVSTPPLSMALLRQINQP
jgi:hypothetical protein